MAMMFIESFDHYISNTDMATKYGWVSGTTPSVSPTGGRRGGGGMVAWYAALRAPMSGADNVVVGCARYHDSVGDGMAFVYTMDSEARWHIAVCETSLGSLTVYKRYDVYGEDNTVLGRTRNYVIQNKSWYYYELKTRINSTVGTVELRVNGVTELNLTGQDTLPNGVDDEIWQVELHAGSYMNTGGLDDIYVLDNSGTTNNDFLGDVRVEAHYPKANGNSVGWTPSTGTNWETVDEHPPNQTDYNYTTTLNAQDTLDVEDLKNVGANVKAVQLLLYHKKNDAGACLMAPVVRLGGTDYVGSDFAPSSDSWRYERLMHDKDPAGNTWTEANFNAAEFGYKKTG